MKTASITANTQTDRKKILLISYHFPPSTAVGGVRIANFAKYLPLTGWNPYVLTVEDRHLLDLDKERLQNLGPATIFKTVQLPTATGIYLKLKNIYASISKKKSPGLTDLDNSTTITTVAPPKTKRLTANLKRYLLAFLSLPDVERNWIIPATIKAIRIIKQHRIECVLTSCPPYSVHLIGLLVKSMTGVRWIVDFRDPWMTASSKIVFQTCDLSIRIERWMEKKVIQSGDLIITNSEPLLRAFKKAYPKLPADKFIYIPNGVDLERVTTSNNLMRYETFTITYTGSLYFGRTPEPLFEAIEALLMEGSIQPQCIKVQLVGHCENAGGIPISQHIRKYHLESVVDVLDPVPYTTAMDMIKRSHIALLLAPNQPYQIPAKVYDYMGVGTKILALAEGGACADLINSTGVGVVISPTDIKEIKNFILQALKEDVSTPQNNSTILRTFDTKVIVGKMSDHLKRIYSTPQF